MDPVPPLGNIASFGNGRQYVCGHCGSPVASEKGFAGSGEHNEVRICPFCNRPTYFGPEGQIPGPLKGEDIDNLPADVASIYREARLCAQAGGSTAAVLVLRKLLMHLAVTHGAEPGRTFVEYVEHLADSGYVPPNGKAWVDRIRTKSNEANHEIVLMTEVDADQLLRFAGMLLKFIYEFPAELGS